MRQSHINQYIDDTQWSVSVGVFGLDGVREEAVVVQSALAGSPSVLHIWIKHGNPPISYIRTE